MVFKQNQIGKNLDGTRDLPTLLWKIPLKISILFFGLPLKSYAYFSRSWSTLSSSGALAWLTFLTTLLGSTRTMTSTWKRFVLACSSQNEFLISDAGAQHLEVFYDHSGAVLVNVQEISWGGRESGRRDSRETLEDHWTKEAMRVGEEIQKKLWKINQISFPCAIYIQGGFFNWSAQRSWCLSLSWSK